MEKHLAIEIVQMFWRRIGSVLPSDFVLSSFYLSLLNMVMQLHFNALPCEYSMRPSSIS